jgi:hypothetical protein
MVRRCTKPQDKSFKNYGGRGIGVAPEWRHDFPRFLVAIGPRPSPGHSLDRYPDNDGPYAPGNVRWATRYEQNRNRRDNTWLTFKGETHCLTDWGRLRNIDR